MRPFALVFAGAVAIPALLHTQQQPPVVQRCESAQYPKKLPAVNALVDSARIVRGLSPTDLAPKGILFSLVYSGSDSFPQIHVIESSIDSAGLLLTNAFVPQKSKQPWAVRLRVSAANAAVTLERSTYCPPVLATRQQVLYESFLVNLSPGDRYMRNLAIRIKADVMLSRTGSVEEVRLSQTTGMRDYDEQIVQFFRMKRYLPALIDGFPMSSWWRSDGLTLRM